MTGSRLDIAFVCTGNRYRSVLAEAAFRATVEGLPVRVGSFGTLDVGPAGPLPEALEAARGLGLDVSHHAARCIVGADLSQASLVLGFETAHVQAAVVQARSRPERTFAILELAELLESIEGAAESDPIHRAEALIARADALRASGGWTASAGEIADPIGLRRQSQEAIAHQVYTAAARLAQQLFGPRPGQAVADPHPAKTREIWFRRAFRALAAVQQRQRPR